MPHYINEKCTACGACVPECPVECIKEGDPMYIITEADCTDCGACVDVCESDAIKTRD